MKKFVFETKSFLIVILSLGVSTAAKAQSPTPTSTQTPAASVTPLPATKLTKATPQPEQVVRGPLPITHLKLCISDDTHTICTDDNVSDVVLAASRKGLTNYKMSLQAKHVKGSAPIKSVRFNIARGTECESPVDAHDAGFIEKAVTKAMDGMLTEESQAHPETLCGFHIQDGFEHFCPLPYGGPLYDHMQSSPLKRPFQPPKNDSEALQRVCKGTEGFPAIGYLAMRMETKTAKQDDSLKNAKNIYAVKVCSSSFAQPTAKVCTPNASTTEKNAVSAQFHFDPHIPNGVVSSIVLYGK